MALAYTIHTIVSQKKRHAPNQVVEVSDADFKDFVKLGAVRTPTEDELALYNQGKPKAKVADAAPAATGPTERDKLEAEAKTLGVKFQKNTSDETLAERIAEAKAAADAAKADSGDDDLVG